MTLPSVTCQLQMVNQDKLFDQLKANAPHAKNMVQRNQYAGKTVIICGAGPSLAQHHDWLWDTKAHQAWGCNSALPYLKDHQLPASHGFCVDQGIEMLGAAEWERTWDVTYLVATSINPKLREHLQHANRRLVWFHNYLGIKNPDGWEAPKDWQKPSPDAGYEMYLYQTIFPPSVQIGYGLNSVPRAMCLALWLGFSTIWVVGADCAAAPNQAPMPTMVRVTDGTIAPNPAYAEWLAGVPLYASGRSIKTAYGAEAVAVEGMIEGRRWVTRTDMLITAKHMVDMALSFPDKIHLIGDTLPNAILGLPPAERVAYIETLPKLAGGGAVEGFGIHKELADQLGHLDTPQGASV